MKLFVITSQYKEDDVPVAKGIFTTEVLAWENMEVWYYELMDYILKNDGRVYKVKYYPAGFVVLYKLNSKCYKHQFVINKFIFRKGCYEKLYC